MISSGDRRDGNNDLIIVILAAGMGTRMKSKIPKVCHMVGDKTMIEHVVYTTSTLNPYEIVVVVSKDNIDTIRSLLPINVRFKIQDKQLGTAHAVLAATPCCNENKNLLVLLGDTPLIRVKTLEKVCRTDCDAVIIGFKIKDITKEYGRIIIENNRVKRIVEYAEATPEEKTIKLCNSGMLWIKKTHLHLIKQITNNNSKHEYYLTDLIDIMVKQKLVIGFLEATHDECIGVNTPEDLLTINTYARSLK